MEFALIVVWGVLLHECARDQQTDGPSNYLRTTESALGQQGPICAAVTALAAMHRFAGRGDNAREDNSKKGAAEAEIRKERILGDI